MDLFDIPHTHYLCTAEQSQSLDQQTIEDFGIPGYTLMEVAGSKTAEHLLEVHTSGDHGLILCGKGNNGGDALVVARYLVQYQIHLTLVFISGTDDLSSDAARNYELLQKMSEQDPHREFLQFIPSWEPEQLDREYDFILDGMLGTGLDSELRGDYQSAVEWTRERKETKYAIDIPTGLHANTGQVMGSAMQVDRTFTFGALKQGFYLNEGPPVVGEPVYVDLPFPNYLKRDLSTILIDESWVEQTIPIERSPASHKYENGVLYIIAGSEGLTGAAVMAAKSAWAGGVGAVMLVCPRGLLPIFETKLTQVITRPVGEADDDHFKAEHLDRLLDILEERPGKVIYGPGIGRQPDTVELTHQLLDQLSGSLLIDADGLWCLAQRDWQPSDDQHIVLTPHPGELSRLLDASIAGDADRLEKTKTFSSDRNVTVLSKGYPVILSSADELTYLTSYDTRIFSRAGFGDVLAGKIGACWMFTDQAEQACIHGLLDGRKKMDPHLKQTDTIHRLEPLDLI